MAQRMMDALEYCKQHGGPVTAKDTEKLKSFTETEIIAEVGFFLKRTTAPNMRLKHKVGWKFVKFTSRHLSHFG